MNEKLKWIKFANRSAIVVIVGLLIGMTVFDLLAGCSAPVAEQTATPPPAQQTLPSIQSDTPTIILPSPTNTPIPTTIPTPTATPWVYPTPIYDPGTDPLYGLPPMLNPIESAWDDDVEVYVLLGSDYTGWRQNEATGTDNTDAFIIVVVNHLTSRINLLSIPRDLYVFIPGFGMSRINTAWKHGGEAMVADIIRYNFGLPLDGYAYIRMDAFSRFIDNALHGLDVVVRKSVYDSCSDIDLDLLPGTHFMDGPTALCYARVRMFDGGFARDTRQREILLAIKAKFQEIAKDDPLGLALDILKSYSSERHYTSIGVDDVMRLMPLALHAEVVEYQLDYLWGVTHFTHPITGAWLLKPPPKECLTTLMYQLVLGDPWNLLPEDWLVEKCGVER